MALAARLTQADVAKLDIFLDVTVTTCNFFFYFFLGAFCVTRFETLFFVDLMLQKNLKLIGVYFAFPDGNPNSTSKTRACE